MPTDHRAKLATIRRFDQLVAYLRDEMGWPIARDSFDDVDDLFYDFTPDELGIDIRNAAKIQEIKRLRPLSTYQPWGIFFVKFEPKQLPVVALRRILSQVTLKKRASANSADRAAWVADDLLFVSNYGEGDSRQINFAHFSQNEAKRDLPTLKVLGWNNLDTALHLDHVAELLTERLAWPDDEEDVEEWGKQWRSAFALAHREVITTSKKLSVELARLARNIRDRINSVLAIETDEGPVSKLMGAFKEALVNDLDGDGFADMYAQTIAYGLLSARVANPTGDTADDFAEAMPVTNPFLKELMETFLDVGGRRGKAGKGPGLDFDELGVSEVVDLLNDPKTKMAHILRDFGDRNPQEDPVIHFYEHFLKEYDAKKRMQRGVFYTPRPVVSFIVRSVDEILRKEFGLKDGLADTGTWGEMVERFDDVTIPKGATADQVFVQILDPATGTGTFLVEVIDLIHKTMSRKWASAGYGPQKRTVFWNQYVPEHLLPRLHGYELMMAPYTIAHMKIGLKLYETGYRFGTNERARIYLTNTLEPAQDFNGTFTIAIPALAHEANAVNDIKQNMHFTVVIGNPPYSNLSSNLTNIARTLIEKYKYIGGDRIRERNALQFERNLNDDYVKFIAWSEDRMHETGLGILSMISNNVYTWSPSLRGMRAHLLDHFSIVRVLDLHGASQRGPAGSRFRDDENVFEIEQPVAIGTFLMPPQRSESSIAYAEILGPKQKKSAFLADQAVQKHTFEPVVKAPPAYRFVYSDSDVEEYRSFISLTETCPLFAEGIKTGRDWLVIDFDRDPIIERMTDIQSSNESDDELCERIGLSRKRAWNFPQARASLTGEDLNKYIAPIAYRAFDERYVFYHPQWVASPSVPVMRNMGLANSTIQANFKVNLAILAGRISRDHKSCLYWCSRKFTDKGIISSLDNVSVFPAIVYPLASEGSLDFGETLPNANLSEGFLAALERVLGLKKPTSDVSALTNWTFEIFHFFYSILWAPSYRKRYGAEFCQDYPSLPLPNNLKLFRKLSQLGGQLVSVHLIEKLLLDQSMASPIRSGDFLVEKVSYSDESIWINKAKTRGFQGVPEDVWNFHIGGYQVCHKWLKDRQAKGGKNPRPGRVLTDEDIDHYQKIVVALNETIRIMKEIDEVIDNHGGWPGAFQTK